MKRITDPDFKYVPSGSTDIRKTFARERKRLADEAAAREKQPKVSQLIKRAK